MGRQCGGSLFGRVDFHYDSYVCPGIKKLLHKHTNQKDRYTMYKASADDCGACSLKSSCTKAPRRGLARHSGSTEVQHLFPTTLDTARRDLAHTREELQS